jgi:hypothetical protein
LSCRSTGGEIELRNPKEILDEIKEADKESKKIFEEINKIF